MKGTAGGPIVDLGTGAVLGMHLGGRYLGGTRKMGWGAPLSALTDVFGPGFLRQVPAHGTAGETVPG